MAVISCKNCGAKVNSEAVACPECGADPRTGEGGSPAGQARLERVRSGDLPRFSARHDSPAIAKTRLVRRAGALAMTGIYAWAARVADLVAITAQRQP